MQHQALRANVTKPLLCSLGINWLGCAVYLLHLGTKPLDDVYMKLLSGTQSGAQSHQITAQPLVEAYHFNTHMVDPAANRQVFSNLLSSRCFKKEMSEHHGYQELLTCCPTAARMPGGCWLGGWGRLGPPCIPPPSQGRSAI